MFPAPSLRRKLETVFLRVAILTRYRTSQLVLYVRRHTFGIVLTTLSIVAATMVVVWWKFWLRAIPGSLAFLARTILDFAHRHPYFSRFVHTSINAIPDFAFVLLALAGLSYLIPEVIEKLQKSNVLRWSTFLVFAIFGISAVIVNSVNREEQERQQRIQRNDIKNLSGPVHDTLHLLANSKGQPNELERRKQIMDTLRSEYVIGHPEASAALIMGTSNPPDEWMRKRLSELGETWPYVSPHPAQSPKQIGPMPLPTPPTEKASVAFTFWSDNSDEFPIRTMNVDTDFPVVTVEVTFLAIGDVTAKNGELWIRICDACRYAEEPQGFQASDPNRPQDRTRRFDLLYPLVPLPKITLRIFPPVIRPKSTPGMIVAGFYSCENCKAIDMKRPDILTVIFPKRH
jgi:hypothetical protein